jgi:heptosyltransferase-2
VLVVGPAWVGDMVMAQSLFMRLHQQYPKALIDVVAPAWSEPLLGRMPEINQTHQLAVGHGEFGFKARWALGRSLRRAHYDQAFVLPRSAKSALVPWLAGIPQRTGYPGEHRYGLLSDIRPLDKVQHYRTVDRFVALADPSGSASATTSLQPHLSSTKGQQTAAKKAFNLDKNTGPILSLCPGAEYGPAKRWPSEYYAALARQYLNHGWRVWLLGSGKDITITASISEQAPGVTDLAGQTTLDQAIDLLAASDVVVSNDSGLMHVAAATGTAVLALYGSSDPQYTPPLSDDAQVIYRGLDCSPCFARECPLRHLNCLREITVEAVAKAVTQAAPARRAELGH